MNEKVINVTHIANPVRVNAATILDITEQTSGNLMLRLSDGRNYVADTSMTVRYCPVPGDYLVTQEDGYEYLNPKDVFEHKYSAMPTSTLPPHQQRVIDEKAELDVRLGKLNDFIDGPKFGAVDDQEQARLRYQAIAMREYTTVLGERIEAFTAVGHHPV